MVSNAFCKSTKTLKTYFYLWNHTRDRSSHLLFFFPVELEHIKRNSDGEVLELLLMERISLELIVFSKILRMNGKI